MSLKVIGGNLTESSDFQHLQEFCQHHQLTITLEWLDGQYWLHSDDQKERPIGIQIDRELARHQEYFKKSSVHKELLARAVGIKSGTRPRILDLTGGFLGDTLLFLSFGCEVTTLERHPVIQVLIQSALNNAKHPALERLTFLPQEAGSFLKTSPAPEVIFFDPMFEDANERALPKKEMRIFRHFVGGDEDARGVFDLARNFAPKRLVVKRPRHSVLLADKPDIQFEGKATRYDVYLPATR
jgi:16S rRNA (guanine1516-N2)-methyltransferase